MTNRPYFRCLFLAAAVSLTTVATRVIASQAAGVPPVQRVLELQPDFTADLSIKDPKGKSLGTGVIAMKGTGWRLEGNFGKGHKKEFVFLKPQDGSQVVLDQAKKIYTDDSDNFGVTLLAPWLLLRELSRDPDTKFEDLGYAEIDGRRLRKLSTTSRGEWTVSFTLFVDSSLHDLVVRIEFEKVVDGKKPSRAVYEITNASFEVSDSLLQIPPGYREVDYW